ncbi:AAA family ATPase [Allosphingosinicella sp.]|jgi:adenylate kinase family enzyme|uniref:AAA family ATPase n=1 Tax=Allosphingosinicella sp. TaxID=2823234 RepID=UPI003D75F9DA
MDRIMIVGQPGSGKSTLARKLAERTGLPVIHIDRIHWQAGWVERTPEEKTRLCLEAEAGARWIFEGGHSATWPSRIERADMLIWLDRPLFVRLRRVIARTVTGLGKSRPDLADDCPERLHLLPGFIHYIWTTRCRSRVQIEALAASAPQGCKVVLLRSDEEAQKFVLEFAEAQDNGTATEPANVSCLPE